MSGPFGDCGCCGGHPPHGGGGDPDPGWVTDYYWAAKHAQVVRDGFPDLRDYYRSINYDSGIRFAHWEEEVVSPAGDILMRDARTFYVGAERLGTRGQFAPFEPYFPPPPAAKYNPYDTRNTVRCYVTAVPAWPGNQAAFWRPGSPALAADNASFPYAGNTVNSAGSEPVPETILDQVEDKLAAGQFLGGRIQYCLQDNPRDVVAVSVVDGPRTGMEWRCGTIPANPSNYSIAEFPGTPGVILHAFDLTIWAHGVIADTRDAFTGLKMRRDKRQLQLGFKSPMPTALVVKTYRKFTIPDGFSLLGGRQPSIGQQIMGAKLPANAVFVEEADLSLEVGDLVDIEPGHQEVYCFDGRPFLFPTPLPTKEEMLTPLVAKARLWRIFPAMFSRFPPYVEVSPFAVATRWTHEDRCLKHEVYRRTDGGAEAMVGVIDGQPEEWPSSRGVGIAGWTGYIDPDNGLVQFPLGYEWAYTDTGTAPGHTYSYRVKSYYYDAIKSAYSASYDVTT